MATSSPDSPPQTFRESVNSTPGDTAVWIGRKLAGRYRVKALLGEGGMGTVFRARDLTMNRDVVIKVPRRSLLLDNSDFRKRFEREIGSMVDLSHLHIVQIYDVGEHEGLPFAVLQYLAGGTLEQQRRRDPNGQPWRLTIEHLGGWLETVAEALDFIHEKGYVHRDVKPSNIFFEGKEVYVGDFGLAKVTEGGTDQFRTRLTQAGVIGTPEYMAPEVALGQEYDGRADQFSLAVMVFELLAGRLPYDGPTATALALKQLTEPVPDLCAVCPHVPAQVAAAVARGMATKPADRFPNCVSFACAVLGKAVPATRSPPAPPPAPPSTQTATVAPTRLELSPPRPVDVAPTQILRPRTVVGSVLDSPAPAERKWILAGVALAALVVIMGLFCSHTNVAVVEGQKEPVASPTRPPRHGPPVITNSIGMEYAPIPVGEFLMGAPDLDSEADGYKKPQHRVQITKPFYLGVYEVTQGRYWQVMGSNPSKFKESGETAPVEGVYWADAQEFCRKLSALPAEQAADRHYRLPTEAEWEYACRAGTTTRYGFGESREDLGAHCWYDRNSGGETHPVGEKKPNAWGLYDMHGNVSEWCQDWYHHGYYGQFKSEPAASTRVNRGGSWYDTAWFCRSAYRYGNEPADRFSRLGFRVALGPSE